METLIKLGGLYHIGFVLFHLMFARLFNWENDLRNLTFVNSAIMRVVNLCLTFAFVIFGYISLAHTQELLSTELGHSLLLLITIFWLLRAIEQVIFFKLKHWISWLLLIIFILGTLLYALPAWQVFAG